MKKLLPLLLATPLLLSACSIDWNNEKDNLFEKKQECEKYVSDATSRYQKINDGSLSIFYSLKLDTCIVTFIGNPELLTNYNSKDPVNPITKKYIIDYLTKENILVTENGTEWLNKTKELKGEKYEKTNDNIPLPVGYEGTTKSGVKFKVISE